MRRALVVAMNRFVRALAIAGLANVLACNQPQRPEKISVHPVGGRLLVGGMPAANAQVAFHVLDGPSAYHPVGITRADGTFSLTTVARDDGAPAGDYIVTVIWPNTSIPFDECVEPATHDRLYGAYSDPAKSTLRATVHLGRNDIVVEAPLGSSGWNVPRVRKEQ